MSTTAEPKPPIIVRHSLDGSGLIRRIIALLIPVVLCLAVPASLVFFCASESASPRGTGELDFLVFVLLGLSCPVVGAMFIGSIVWLGLRPRKLIPQMGLACAISWFVGCLVGGSVGNHIQRNALVQLAERSKPLIAAIKNYEQKTGHPPDSLDVLVPEFIAEVPTTGIGTTPDYQYRSLTNSSSYGNNKWVLEVPHAATSAGLFTSFIYLPGQDYSVLPHGEVMWRIAGWAYWNEG
jgi:hypothetical protein